MTERELAPGMSRVKFHRVKDFLSRIEWAYQVQGVDLIRYMCCPVMGETAMIFAPLSVPGDVIEGFAASLKEHLERWFISDGWGVDLPSDVVQAVDACLEDVIKEKKEIARINQSLGFGG